MDHAVRLLRPDESPSERLGHVMASAFMDRPGFRYMIPDEERRKEALPWFFGTFLRRLAQRKGEVYTTDDEAGGALWIRPRAEMTYRDALHAGLLTMPFRLGLDGFRRALRLHDAVDAARARKQPAPHWYLLSLGVDPQRQGQGIGSALMQPVLKKADADERPCYLETFTESNLDYYRRFGFEVAIRDFLEDIPFWGMVRNPRAQSRR